MKNFYLFAFLFILGCVSKLGQSDSRTTIGNPASQNCIDKGGRLTIEENAANDEYGVCHFSENRQCEEWTMFRGTCPIGGITVTGYSTDAARYCVIRGGRHQNRRTCFLPDGRVCNAQKLYSGECQ
jgi:putative hemolysin